jgi:hypothetical protein
VCLWPLARSIDQIDQIADAALRPFATAGADRAARSRPLDTSTTTRSTRSRAG